MKPEITDVTQCDVCLKLGRYCSNCCGEHFGHIFDGSQECEECGVFQGEIQADRYDEGER